MSNWLKAIRKSSKRRLVLLGLGLVVIVLLIITGIICYTNQKQTEVNLLSPQDWSHLAGAEIVGNGIHIKPVGRVLTHKDTSPAQLNPPVNVRGSHLNVSGDFRVEATMSGVDNGASLQLYGQMPIIYDEWRQERGSVRLEANGNGVSIRIWDGTSPSSIDERIFRAQLKRDMKVTLSHKADKILVRVDKKELGSIPDHGIFANGTIWIGADANLGSEGWTLTSLKASALGKGRVELVAPPPLAEAHDQSDALRNLASANPRQLPIGAAVSTYPLFTDDQYRKTVLGQFSMITPENSLKPQFVHPQKNLYAYQDADSLVETAQKNQMLVHGHALVLGKANPQWMQKTPENERKQVMTDHINNVVSHYKGKIADWDVVNEALSEDDVDYTNQRMGLRKQMWFDAMGESYIDTAFRAARAADPAAKLYLNDYGIEKDGKRWDALVALVQRLQTRGVPIDGVGFEAHIYKEPDVLNPEVLQQHIQILAKLGIVSRISEIDVLGDDPAVQASQYAGVLKVCLSEPTCTSYTTWGVTDRYGSTTISERYPAQLSHSLLWAADYKPKSAVSSLQDTLKQR